MKAAAAALMAVFGYHPVEQSCYSCSHNQPQGCDLLMPEYEVTNWCRNYADNETEEN